MKTALQMTMHYVRNYGSVLQAYALQRAIDSVPGWRCETLDIRPHWQDGGWSMLPPAATEPPAVGDAPRRGLVARLRGLRLSSALARARGAFRSRFVIRPWERMFDEFLANELRLTGKSYRRVDELRDSPPLDDLYVTGSDQTFNPRFTRGEDVWFWSFLPEERRRVARKISYAASFAGSRLRKDSRAAYERWLPTYDALSLRESSGVGIARDLGVSAAHCCDPVLLLDRDRWRMFASRGRIKTGKPYILCYNLQYAVDPYPMAEVLEREVSSRMNLPIVHLQEAPVQGKHATGRVLRGVSPYDFVSLFLNAAFVMTSSFHGTAFAMLSGVPFLTYVNENAKADSRAFDLLAKCAAERHAVVVPTMSGWAGDLARFETRQEEADALLRFRAESTAWLHEQMAQANRMKGEMS